MDELQEKNVQLKNKLLELEVEANRLALDEERGRFVSIKQFLAIANLLEEIRALIESKPPEHAVEEIRNLLKEILD